MNTIQTSPAAQTAATLSDDERQPCEIWTRVMGYHRPMSSFNIGKKGEFHERKYFTEQGARLAA
ncbi:anaerobic ribonucleoside-triphosphate reductase [Pollutimonas bauzanensis]|uniref:Anaerobic ribonucleoside-triphosphate reductase n=1 Tax=Pollutimonas bauzanensis TaxID=658167 RepID=A0A1M5XRS3_9BURK|nr:anaerobic ribonucleoside-triphosphate reductase [Pollutimonas bauzanensis]SHI02244.1 Anaerobic ribonucleoside-triphosphate reductase [Pollutimonas bauzanensis]